LGERASQTVTITALNAAPLCSVAPDSTSSHSVPAAQKRLRLWNYNFAEIASELRNLSSRSRKPPMKQTYNFGIQTNVTP